MVVIQRVKCDILRVGVTFKQNSMVLKSGMMARGSTTGDKSDIVSYIIARKNI